MRVRLTIKVVIAVLFVIIAICLFLNSSSPPEESDEVCGRTAAGIVDSIVLDTEAQTVFNDFARKRIHYDMVSDDDMSPDLVKPRQPFTIFTSVEMPGSFVIARKDIIMIRINARGRVEKKSCEVYLTGP